MTKYRILSRSREEGEYLWWSEGSWEGYKDDATVYASKQEAENVAWRLDADPEARTWRTRCKIVED